MTISLSEAEIARLQKKGAKVRRPGKPAEMPARPSQEAKPPEGKQFSEAAIVSAIAAESMEKITNSLAEAMKKLGARKPYPYKFTIKRDKAGKMIGVDADPVV